jgi:hypothetical protein
MARKSIGSVEAAEGTMVACPKCGGREFEVVICLAAVNLYLIHADHEKPYYWYNMVSISDVMDNKSFTCKNCLARLDQKAA